MTGRYLTYWERRERDRRRWRVVYAASRVAIIVAVGFAVLVLSLSAGGCNNADVEQQKLRADKAEAALAKAVTCVDEATLLATTAGSPDAARCSSPRHVIEGAPISAGTEEVGAMIVCRCRPASSDGGAK